MKTPKSISVEQAESTSITTERLSRELERIATADPRKLYRDDGTLLPPSEWDEATVAAISGINVTRTGKIKLTIWDPEPARKALERIRCARGKT
jgi:hypothetical protein